MYFLWLFSINQYTGQQTSKQICSKVQCTWDSVTACMTSQGRWCTNGTYLQGPASRKKSKDEIVVCNFVRMVFHFAKINWNTIPSAKKVANTEIIRKLIFFLLQIAPLIDFASYLSIYLKIFSQSEQKSTRYVIKFNKICDTLRYYITFCNGYNCPYKTGCKYLNK